MITLVLIPIVLSATNCAAFEVDDEYRFDFTYEDPENEAQGVATLKISRSDEDYYTDVFGVVYKLEIEFNDDETDSGGEDFIDEFWKGTHVGMGEIKDGYEEEIKEIFEDPEDEAIAMVGANAILGEMWIFTYWVDVEYSAIYEVPDEEMPFKIICTVAYDEEGVLLSLDIEIDTEMGDMTAIITRKNTIASYSVSLICGISILGLAGIMFKKQRIQQNLK